MAWTGPSSASRAGPTAMFAKTADPGASSATGPWAKSAAEYGSAQSCATSFSLRLHSRAVA